MCTTGGERSQQKPDATATGGPQATGASRRGNAVDYRLEVVRIPVSDVDRAKDFYQG
jgi:hypothetical protein